MSILHVLLNIPGGTQRQLPVCETTTLVWQVPSNFSSALKKYKIASSFNFSLQNNCNVKSFQLSLISNVGTYYFLKLSLYRGSCILWCLFVFGIFDWFFIFLTCHNYFFQITISILLLFKSLNSLCYPIIYFFIISSCFHWLSLLTTQALNKIPDKSQNFLDHQSLPWFTCLGKCRCLGCASTVSRQSVLVHCSPTVQILGIDYVCSRQLRVGFGPHP